MLLGGNALQNEFNDVINITDLRTFSAFWTSDSSQVQFEPGSDFDCNNRIDLQDFAILSKNYGISGPIEIIPNQ